MKQPLCLLLALVLCLSLPGCAGSQDSSATFYYSRDPALYQYFEEDGVIRSELRDLTGHKGDLRYMIGLYLAGPLEEELIEPFTKSARLLQVTLSGSSLTVELSDLTDAMTDAEFSLACACLTLTCVRELGCGSVTVLSGKRSLTMTEDSILIYDPLPPQETNGG